MEPASARRRRRSIDWTHRDSGCKQDPYASAARNPRQPSRGSARLISFVAAALLGVGALNGTFARPATAADARANLAAVRQRIDAIANQYFAAQNQSKALTAQLEDLRRTIAATNADINATRQIAVAAAASMYRSQSSGYARAPVATTALDDARAALFAQEANSRNFEIINRYIRSLASLSNSEQSLTRRQHEADLLTKTLRQQAGQLDNELRAAQRSYNDLLAAQARALAAAQSSTSAANTGRSGGGPSATTNSAATNITTGRTTPATTPATPSTSPTPPPPPPGANGHHNDPFLSCVRQRESRGIYAAVNPGGYYGAYQFGPRTWDITASHAGRPQLIGVRPDHAAPWDQDELAWTLYQWQGKGPWGGHCP